MRRIGLCNSASNWLWRMCHDLNAFGFTAELIEPSYERMVEVFGCHLLQPPFAYTPIYESQCFDNGVAGLKRIINRYAQIILQSVKIFFTRIPSLCMQDRFRFVTRGIVCCALIWISKVRTLVDHTDLMYEFAIFS